MQNVNLRTEAGGKLIIEVDLNQNLGRSKSGKSIVIATTGGAKTIPDTPKKLVLTVYE